MPWPMRFGPAAQDMIFLRSVGVGLALLLVGRVHVGGTGRELGRAGVDPLVHRAHPERMAVRSRTWRLAACRSACARRRSEKPMRFRCRSSPASRRPARSLRPAASCLDDLLDLRQEPRIDVRIARRPPRASCRRGTHRPRTRCAPGRARRARSSSTSAVARSSRFSRRRRSPGRAAPSAATPGRCGRSPSPRRPTSSAWSGGCRPAGNFSNAKRGILVTT